jgi:phenylpropionate dioxygenase-like ring-hydroxylating dioxygenase large terminal subunit
MPEDKMVPRSEGASARFTGYYTNLESRPDTYLTRVGKGTPPGEYLRRFWHPIAYFEELKEVPLRVRALGEDLVVFRDKSGQIGLMHLRCSHRNTSLEFGVIEERGIRCCYHGRHYDIDGTILEMPGEPAAVLSKNKVRQGAYPTHVFGGIVFGYMGPPDKMPVFPMYDRFNIPGVRLVPGPRWPAKCNWLQIQENTMDPAHTATLHAIPQLRGTDHFATEFGNFPELITWAETPAGYIYMAVRQMGENVWVRSAEALGPTMRCISSIFENGATRKPASLPFMSFWILPVDDDETCHFFVSHVSDEETMPFEQRRALENFCRATTRRKLAKAR